MLLRTLRLHHHNKKKKHNRVIEDDDEFVDPPLRETAKVCNSTRASDETHSADSAVNVLVSPQKQYKNKTVEKDTWESDDAVLITPPKQYTNTTVLSKLMMSL
ncbi:unnamed protein product [Brassica oleracea]